ncbi:MAG: transposase [Elusimicrobia bacterium]|nr:transposase [Elusimicrobiota bacterium]
MFTPEDKQKDFYDTYVYDRRVKDSHELIQIKNVINWSFVEEKTRKLYCSNNGRPGYAPGVLFRILFLEYYANLSDAAVCDQVEVNLRYQKFVGIRMDDEIPEPTTLVEFRKRLGEETIKELFDELIRQCKEHGILTEGIQSIDATHITADVAVSNMVNLLRQGRRKVLWYLKKHQMRWSRRLREKYPSDIVKARGKPSIKQLKAEIETTTRFIKELLEKYDDPRIKEYLAELQKLCSGEIGLVSFEDTDARWGHKSTEKKFSGYKAHTSMDESGIVTSAQTIPGNANEGGMLEDMIADDESKGVRSECIAVDGLYDRADTYETGDTYEMEIYAPCRHGPKGFEKEYFFFDKRGHLRCRNYSIGGIDLRHARRLRRSFYAFDCQLCLSKGSCLAKGTIQRQVWLNKCCERSMKQNKQEREEALEKRKRIEAKFGEAKKWHGLHRARYRGRWRVAIQVLMTFFVTNAKRMVKLLFDKLSPPGSLKVKYA